MQDAEIQSNAAALIPEMVNVLNKVPREMLLIFKTNDCLRGIDSRLKTRFRANAFISMTRSCTAAVFDDQIRRTDGWWEELMLRFQKLLALYGLDLTQLFLRYFAFSSTNSQSGAVPV